MSAPAIVERAELRLHECDCDRCTEDECELVRSGWKASCCTFGQFHKYRPAAVAALVDHLGTAHGIVPPDVLVVQSAKECPKCADPDGCEHCEDGIVYADERLNVSAQLVEHEKAQRLAAERAAKRLAAAP